MTCDVTPRYVEADPFEGGKQAVAECWRNLCAVGAEPIALTDNLNFGNPERPEIMGQFVLAVRGIGEAAKALEFPVVSGNVSLYNETNGQGITANPNHRGCRPAAGRDQTCLARLQGARQCHRADRRDQGLARGFGLSRDSLRVARKGPHLRWISMSNSVMAR